MPNVQRKTKKPPYPYTQWKSIEGETTQVNLVRDISIYVYLPFHLSYLPFYLLAIYLQFHRYFSYNWVKVSYLSKYFLLFAKLSCIYWLFLLLFTFYLPVNGNRPSHLVRGFNLVVFPSQSIQKFNTQFESFESSEKFVWNLCSQKNICGKFVSDMIQDMLKKKIPWYMKRIIG